jgi:hypothetical protein
MSAPTIDYAPAQPRRRRWLRRIILGIAAVILGCSAWRWGPQAGQQLDMLWSQRHCLYYSAPADQVVYEEDPAAATGLLARSGYFQYVLKRGLPPTAAPTATAAAHVPECWSDFQVHGNPLMMQAGRAYGAILFLHERTCPSGNRRLVCVRYFPEAETFTPSFIPGYNCELIVITPGTFRNPPKPALRMYVIDVLSGWPRTPPNVRMFAGQPDPNDASHFTIRYQMWGKEDILDGRLGDDDQVTLTPRNRPTEP